MNLVGYHIWNGDDLPATICKDVKWPNGGTTRENIGEVTIKKGDAFYLDYGASYMKSTMSGKGPESQYPYGKVILYGEHVATAVLTKENAQFAQHTKGTREELRQIQHNQELRIAPQIEPLIASFIAKRMAQNEATHKRKMEEAKNNKARIAEAINKMDSALKKQAHKPT